MRYFLKSRYVVQVVLVLLLVSGLLGLWQGTLLYLPLPDFIPTLARSIPADAVLVACAVTAIALAAYPTTRIWEQVAPRGVLACSHLLAVSLGLFACLTFSAACLWGPASGPVLVKLLGLLGLVSILYRPLGPYVSLLPPSFLLLTTVFARRPGGDFAPWAWLFDAHPNPTQVLLTCALAGLVALALQRWGPKGR